MINHQKEQLILAFPVRNLSQVKQRLGLSQEIGWVYLGRDFFKRRYIEQRLERHFRYIDISKLQDEVARDIRLEHVQWIDALNRCYGKNLEWWFASIASRDTYNSNLFQYCCYLEILERLWKDKTHRPRLIFIESFGLAKAIQKWAFQKNAKVEFVHYYYGKIRSLVIHLNPFRVWIKFVVILLLRLVAAFFSKRRYKSKNINKINSPIIIDTFVHNNCLSKEGIFKDHYYPYLHEYLKEKAIPVIVHPVLYGFHYNYFSLYERMRKSNTYFIIREDFLKTYDYILALSYPLKFLYRKIEIAYFRDFALLDIIKEEQKTQLSISSLEAGLIYHLFLRLGKTSIQPKIIINWYENQVIDKALIAAARKAFPQTKIIGTQMFIHSPNCLNLFPSQSEVQSGLVPDILLETSKRQCLVARAFTNAIPCKPAAALRYAHLFNIRKPHLILAKDRQIILVLLSFSIMEALEVLDILNTILGQIREDVSILIKNHPDYSAEDLIRVFGRSRWPDRFEVFKDDLAEILDRVSMVIVSNSSSMMEAAAKGIPIIFLGRQTALNHNVLSDLKIDFVTECFSNSELLAGINKYLSLSAEKIYEYRKTGINLRNLFFEPVNTKTLSSFIESDGN